MTSNSTASGTRARIASVACCSHSPASGPIACAPVRRSPSETSVRKPGLRVVGARVRRGARHLGQRHGRAEGALALAHGRGLRVGEDDARHRAVVRLRARAQDVRRDDAALVLADVGQRPHAGDVADRPQAVPERESCVDGQPVRLRPRRRPSRARALRPAGAGPWPRAGGRRAAPSRRRTRARSPRRRGGPRSRAARSAARCRLRPAPRRPPRRARAARAAARGRAPSTSATEAPNRASACAISTPTGPPPSTSSRRGTSVTAVASRFVHTPSSSRSPGIGGITGSEPVASTMCSAV